MSASEPRILALGKFDSLHIGHRQLVATAAGMGPPGIIRLDGLAATLGWEHREPLLSADQWAAVVADWGWELGRSVAVVAIAFAAVRQLAPGDFLRLLRDRHGIGGLVVGEDFRFGHQRRGDVAFLRAHAPELGLRLAVVPPVCHAGAVVSTTRVREAVGAGLVAEVAGMLARPYRLEGRVGHGAGRGRELGFPTVNCQGIVQLLPAEGVYAGRVGLEDGPQDWPAAINIGRLPTCTDGHERSVEAHLIGWHGDAYDRAVRVDLVAHLREERRFDGVEALRVQIARDVERAGALL